MYSTCEYIPEKEIRLDWRNRFELGDSMMSRQLCKTEGPEVICITYHSFLFTQSL